MRSARNRTCRSGHWLSAVTIILISSEVIARAVWPRADLQAADIDYSKDGNDSSIYDYPDQSALCSRAPSSCTPRRWWNNFLDGTQLTWTDLNDNEVHLMWTDAVAAGTKLKQAMDEAIDSDTTRLSSSSQDLNFRNYYHRGQKGIYPVSGDLIHSDIIGPFNQADIKGNGGQALNFNVDFSGVQYFASRSAVSATTGESVPVLEIFGNPDAGVIVSTYTYANHDLNDGENKAFSSTISWNAWMAIAGDKASNLVAQMRDRISNQETKNIMDIAHSYFPHRVIPPPPDAVETSVYAGHGVWRTGDEAYLALLSTPNVKTCVNMVVDRHLVMKNPYILEVHTFPSVQVPSVAARDATIILKYGPKPASAGAESSSAGPTAGTVQTA